MPQTLRRRKSGRIFLNIPAGSIGGHHRAPPSVPPDDKINRMKGRMATIGKKQQRGVVFYKK
jgi:hypothetical protein